MKLILRENVTHLGEPGDLVDVASGYGRNYLIPKGLAVRATEANRRLIDQQMAKLKARSEEQRVAAEGVSERLAAISLRMPRKVADEDTLYGSVSVADIAEALEDRDIQIEKGNVHLEHPIKKLGDYEVPIALAHGVAGTVKVAVVPEGAEGAEASQVQAPTDAGGAPQREEASDVSAAGEGSAAGDDEATGVEGVGAGAEAGPDAEGATVESGPGGAATRSEGGEADADLASDPEAPVS